ncbi:asparaginase [Sphingopyxis sp. YF1]|jgi:L-asparaginase|uniref:asparaginase domain-containing protein n=1 Tax=Sphingopyxis sp. YF1 TaxID=2482763 RepID=UPI001F6091F3|nr:asparaginase domain-containing protein [Sphingopyxis sp. YF1]UNU42047.1 asparaginase [Sphingopyxis sp. YF1]
MIDIFTTGGTIDKVYFDALSEFQIGPAAIPDMLRENNVHVAHRVTQLMRKDSLELDDADRETIRAAVAASDAAHILVTHGTDTMVVTGRVLAGIAGKTIVLTGAMQPASVRASDAEFNVGFALAAVQTLPPGVYVAMNGMIFDPATTTKDRAAGRFRSDGQGQ